MFQNESNMSDADRLEGVVNYARSVFLNLGEELRDETRKAIPWSAVRRVASATKWIEERLAVTPSHQGPFRKGRGSVQELDALARRALGTLRRIGRALEREKKGRAWQIAVTAEAMLEDRLHEIDQYVRCRSWGLAA